MRSAGKWPTTSAISTPSATNPPIPEPAAASAPFAWKPRSKATANSSYEPRAGITQARNRPHRLARSRRAGQAFDNYPSLDSVKRSQEQEARVWLLKVRLGAWLQQVRG